MNNTCLTCKQEKELTSNFDKTTQTKSGYRNVCKQCRHDREYNPTAANKKAELRDRYENDPAFREEKKAQAAAHYLANKERKKLQSRRSALKRHYKMTPEQYDAKVEGQGGVCAICKRKPEERDSRRKGLCVDHDHACCDSPDSCGKCVRGLLCNPCNTAIAHFGDHIDLLLAAINYLQSFQK